MRIRPVGATALLPECPDIGQVEAWRAELWRRRDAGELNATEIVPAARTVLVDGLTDPLRLLLSRADLRVGLGPRADWFGPGPSRRCSGRRRPSAP